MPTIPKRLVLFFDGTDNTSKPATGGAFSVARLLVSQEAPYVGLGVLSLLILFTALVLQVRRGRE